VEVLHSNLYAAVPGGAYDLIIANPPFLPVPPGVHYAMCGHGGEDGMVILKPLLEGIPERLTPAGTALVYAEGVGDAEGPFVRHLLNDLARRERLDAQLVVTSRLSVKSALVLKAASLGRLKRQPAAELAEWRALYQRLLATHTYNYLVRIRRGQGHIGQIMAFDPHREELGIEVQPGVVLKPR
jgi:methylase of polypeptide subunit release factors